MTGQIEEDKPSRLKEERFPSLSLIARELHFSELNRASNTQYLLQIGHFQINNKFPSLFINLIVSGSTAFL